MSEATRIAALKAAVELRTGASKTADIKAVAQEFDDWLTRRISSPTPAADVHGNPSRTAQAGVTGARAR